PLENMVAKVAAGKNEASEFLVDYIPPGGSKKITTTFSDIPFLTNGSYVITIQVGEQTHKKSVRISFIPDVQLLLVIGGLIGGSTIIAAITFHTGSVLIQRRKRKNSIRR
ncbi:MAG: hypothetical protein Q7T54_05090, partial [Candidatus Levybacteria bacterium]|nr:hypothetical protein [Candidatus Levybacteria bacterium]